MQNQENKTVLAVVSDLFFASKITEAAKRAGVTLEYVTAEKDVWEKARSNPALIIFDLNFDAVHPVELIGKLKGNPALKHISLLGYLSHVQAELKMNAQEAGCDVVMPRSAFSMNLPQILSNVGQDGIQTAVR
jgi:PleD family two-component response regulator